MKYTAFVSILFLYQYSIAQDLTKQLKTSEVNQQALQETQALLINPEQRNQAIKNNDQAKKVDGMVKDLMGDSSEDMYKTAAEIMPYISKMGDGDPQKMNQFIQNALRDPASFANNLPPELKQKVSDLAKKAKPLPSVLPSNSANKP